MMNSEAQVLKVLLVAQNDYKGGAGRAVARIHQMLTRYGPELGISCQLRVIESEKPGPGVTAGLPGRNRFIRRFTSLRILFSRAITKSLLERKGQIQSFALIRTGLAREINSLDFDVVNLHWLGDGTLSIKETGELKPPTVMTIHDMWPMGGSSHFFGQDSSPDLLEKRKGPRDWLNHALMGLKRKHWWGRVTAVSPTPFMRELAQRSPVFHQVNVEVLPIPIDTDYWRPGNKNQSRFEMSLNPSSFVILFVSAESPWNPRKGYDLLLELSGLLAQNEMISPQVEIVIVGRPSGKNPASPKCTLGLHELGKLDDPLLLRAYQAADILLIPSREDNLPQVGIEAMAAGLPVLAFDLPGTSSYISHGESGWLVPPFMLDKMVQQISTLAQDRDLVKRVGDTARTIIVEKQSMRVLAPRYASFYRALQHTHR